MPAGVAASPIPARFSIVELAERGDSGGGRLLGMPRRKTSLMPARNGSCVALSRGRTPRPQKEKPPGGRHKGTSLIARRFARRSYRLNGLIAAEFRDFLALPR